MAIQPLFDEPFLRAHWGSEFEVFQAGPEAAALLARLQAWTNREQLTERSSETAFIQRFFAETWGYRLQGHAGTDAAYTCRPQYEVACAGQSGGTGFADLALGRFGQDADGIPQVLCEFKDIRSGLDARQLRKQNDRSPVDQCFDYLQSAWQARDRDATVEPAFALVTDMNEFRLYIRRLGKSQCQRFLISGGGAAPGLLTDHPAAAFRRFLFWRLFQPDLLLAEHGAPRLDRLLRDQVTREKAIEKTFYREYHDYRQFVFRTLVEANPGFPGTRGKLVRLTQRFLDRCIFILFCEDMGRVLRYRRKRLPRWRRGEKAAAINRGNRDERENRRSHRGGGYAAGDDVPSSIFSIPSIPSKKVFPNPLKKKEQTCLAALAVTSGWIPGSWPISCSLQPRTSAESS